jgi:hypothetical protein
VGRPFGAVVIGNALHWMDEGAVLRRSAGLLRPHGAVAVVTQGPPLWLGPAPWQVRVREVLEETVGSASALCGTDHETLQVRADTMRALGLDVQVHEWTARHDVTPDWVAGHVGSAVSPSRLGDESWPRLVAAIKEALDDADRGSGLQEEVLTTAVVGRVAGASASLKSEADAAH